MNEEILDKWWASLTYREKKRVYDNDTGYEDVGEFPDYWGVKR